MIEAEATVKIGLQQQVTDLPKQAQSFCVIGWPGMVAWLVLDQVTVPTNSGD